VKESSSARELGTHITVIAEAESIGVCFVLTKVYFVGFRCCSGRIFKTREESTQ